MEGKLRIPLVEQIKTVFHGDRSTSFPERSIGRIHRDFLDRTTMIHNASMQGTVPDFSGQHGSSSTRKYTIGPHVQTGTIIAWLAKANLNHTYI
jgi:hypothetical protein